jgi:pyridoxine 4-dehydrogenase
MGAMDASHAGTISIGDLTVPRMGYGTMRLSGPRIFGPPADRAEAVRVLRRALEIGVRAMDTSWYYGPYVTEEIVAEALHPYPDELVLITKLGGKRGPDASWFSALSPAELREGCEHDLRLLRLESVPVAHLRWIDHTDVPFAEALGAMIDLQREGKIQRIGLSSVSLEQYEAARRQTPIVTVSNPYSVVQREDEPLVEACERDGVAYLPFFPLGASPIESGATAHRSEAVAAVAARLGASAVQVALAWLLGHSPALLPIPGTSSVAHLEENVAAADLDLSAEDVARLDG